MQGVYVMMEGGYMVKSCDQEKKQSKGKMTT